MSFSFVEGLGGKMERKIIDGSTTKNEMDFL